jgi:HEAT repeat protein
MKRRRVRPLPLAAGVAAFFVCAVAAAIVLFAQVEKNSVRDISAAAQREFPGDRVTALIAKATSTEQPLRARNRAIWALGVIGDERALPARRELEVQGECDHSRLACQREVRKAIRKIRGEMTPWHTLRRGLDAAREWAR